MEETLATQNPREFASPSSRSETHAILDSLRRIVHALRLFSKESERDLGISAAQLFVLEKIAESKAPPSINDLASATLTHQSSVSVVVAKLGRHKLIERVPSGTDSRKTELKITPKGAALLKKGPGSIHKRFLDAISSMSVADRHGLVVGLHRLVLTAGFQDATPPMLLEDKLQRKPKTKS